jgi:hypothetical protein
MPEHFDKLSATPKRPLKVFLCHAHDDKSKARELYRYLKRRGIQPWLDAENLLPGQHWQTEIPKAIETSDAIIICLSKSSVDKEGYVQKEIKFALDKALEMPEGRIFIIPARLDECDVPRSLSSYQWVDLFDEGGYEKLMKSLKLRAVSVPNPEMAKMIIKNSSRLDLELRIAVPAWIAPGVRDLEIAGAILLDIAYLEKEVDQMRVFGAELNTSESEKMKENLTLNSNRITIEDSMERLVKKHVKIRKTIVSQIIGGGVAVPEPLFDTVGGIDPWKKVLDQIKTARQNYQEILEEEKKWLLEGVEKLEGHKADDMLRNYRRAINEIILSGPGLPQEELGTMIGDIALHERINEGKLPKALWLLSERELPDADVNQNILKDIRKMLKKFEDQRLGIVLYISDEVATLQNYIYAIGEQYSDVRPELDEIIGELAKEPSVSSEYLDDGHVRLTLSCYAIHLERRLEIQHKINRDIEWRFNGRNIRFDRSSQGNEIVEK